MQSGFDFLTPGADVKTELQAKVIPGKDYKLTMNEGRAHLKKN